MQPGLIAVTKVVVVSSGEDVKAIKIKTISTR